MYQCERTFGICRKALNLFLEEDEEKAKQTAEELKELNDLRKTMTENGVKEALDRRLNMKQRR